MSRQVALQDWMAATADTTLEMVGAALGFDDSTVGEVREAPRGLPGAYIALIAPDEAVQIGLVAEMAGMQGLAKAMLGMAPEDEDLPSGDVADAVGEIVNMLAGGIKKRMIEKVGSVTLGLPLFIHGHIEPTEKLDIHSVEVRLGPVPAALLVVRERETR